LTAIDLGGRNSATVTAEGDGVVILIAVDETIGSDVNEDIISTLATLEGGGDQLNRGAVGAEKVGFAVAVKERGNEGDVVEVCESITALTTFEGGIRCQTSI